MTRCLDIHTHHAAPQPEGVISVEFDQFNPIAGQLYSVGIHPWVSYRDFTSEAWEEFRKLAMHPQVVAIGECGIDKLKGGFLFNQLLIMKRQIEVSEELGKPLIIHDVKAHDVITGLRRDMEPRQKWAVHGFRYKPTVAKMLIDTGIYLSYGSEFNPESLKITPREMILAETDESPLSIEEIISKLSSVIGEDLTDQIAENSARFLSLE
ncbi:MAG: TatD family hydrolase [Muribaculaceae bacterium]|nr:TatD family hydrolase [Muribaculaceae bacterium]